MAPLHQDLRKQLEKVIVEAREVSEDAARAALQQLAIDQAEPFKNMATDRRELRVKLRAKGRQLGDALEEKKKTQSIQHLTQECSYQYWHRMLFARFLAENHLLIHPDLAVPVTLEECEELAKEEKPVSAKKVDKWVLAGRFAAKMLPQVFRHDDPVLQVSFAPENQQALEKLLEALPSAVFIADDSLGWVYQFWQSKRKDEVNASGNKIGADELPAVTQLFTEDYMVDFLLDNTLGAWWAGKVLAANRNLWETAKSEEELRRAASLPSVPWNYLRFIKGQSGKWHPAAWTLDGWPKTAKELKCLDPCMGSGHFVVAMFTRLVALRMAEEKLSEKAAVESVIRENLFGLEIDPRCTQIGAFNLALAAWRRVGYCALPTIHLACSGLGVAAKKDEWVGLAGKSESLRKGMELLHDLFQKAPVLGSLINPRAVGGDLFVAAFHELQPLLEAALKLETTDDAHELAVTAKGIAEAAEILASQFTLVATNVPYLARGKQDGILQDFCESKYPESKTNLATACIQRCTNFCREGGAVAVVSVQTWLFQVSYRNMRKNVLRAMELNVIAPLGMRSFQTQLWDFPVALLVATQITAGEDHSFAALNLGDSESYESSSTGLRTVVVVPVEQKAQMDNPDFIITLGSSKNTSLVGRFASCVQGIKTGDDGRVRRSFWELREFDCNWKKFQSTVSDTKYFGGLEHVLWWGDSGENLARRQGLAAWGKLGVAISQMSNLPCAVYLGEPFDSNMAALVPRRREYLEALVAFCFSEDFAKEVRRIDQALKPTNSTFEKIRFDYAHWENAAKRSGPLPSPCSYDPTQWLFKGNVDDSTAPLQVGVARLVGYRWPDQEPDALDERADADGIVCLPAAHGKQAAADRLRDLLATAYGKQWSPAKESELLASAEYNGESLDEWFRDGFFHQHCDLFHQLPFIWHIWDGRKDGFSALVNYHKLDRKLLEKLIYTYLGDWIKRQQADVDKDKTGAEARLVAAQELQDSLKLIAKGEKPYDIFVRWKPIEQQPNGWEPDLNDGVRMNIRPFVEAGVLRKTPNIKWGKDRGKDPESAPWYKVFKGDRINDHHLTLAEKQAAREKAKHK